MDIRELLAVNRVLSASDLSYNELVVLVYVAQNPNTIVGPIASAVSLLPAAVSRTINHLEAQGAVERKLDGDDRRKLRVNLTKIGNMLYQELSRELGAI